MPAKQRASGQKEDLDRVNEVADAVDSDTSAGGLPRGSESKAFAVAGLCNCATETASNASTPTSSGAEPPEDVRENLPRIASRKTALRSADRVPFASVFNNAGRLSTVPLLDKLKGQAARPPPGLEMPLNTKAKPFVPRCDYSPTAFPCSSHLASVPKPR